MPRSDSEGGFTLIELLVVVAIIAILSAIALPAFLGEKRSASDSKAKSDASTAYHALEAYWAEHDSYSATRAELVAIEGALTSTRNLQVVGTLSTFRLSTDSKQGATFTIEKDATGRVVRDCVPVGVGGCDASGHW